MAVSRSSSSAASPSAPARASGPAAPTTAAGRSWRRVGADPDSQAEAEIAAYVARAQGGSLEAVPALSAFQRRMEQFPQLSPDAQAEMHARYRAGVEAQATLDAGGRIGPRKRSELTKAVRDGKRAQEYLAGSTFRLVLLICRDQAEKRYGRERAMEVLAELVAEANVALTEAIAKYDPNREGGSPVFATYAARVVRDRVSMTLAQDGAVHLPPAWSRLKRIAAVRIPQLAAELGRQPTEDEIRADLLEKCMEWAGDKLTDEQRKLPKAERIKVMQAKLRKQGMLGAIRALQEVLAAAQAVSSLDATVGEDGSTTRGDMLADAPADSLLDDVEYSELRSTFADILASLGERDRTIILLRYGFADGTHWTYQAIGQRFGVTAERIRQIERNVLNRLHQGPTRDRLAAFLPSLEEADLDAHRPDPSAVR